MKSVLPLLCLLLLPSAAHADPDVGKIALDFWLAYKWYIILSLVITIGPYILVSIWAAVQDNLEERARRERGGPPQNPDPNSITTIYNQYDKHNRRK